jgi:hypothetical protein
MAQMCALGTRRCVQSVTWVVNGEIDVAPGSNPSAEGEFGLPNMSLNSVPELPSAIS